MISGAELSKLAGAISGGSPTVTPERAAFNLKLAKSRHAADAAVAEARRSSDLLLNPAHRKDQDTPMRGRFE